MSEYQDTVDRLLVVLRKTFGSEFKEYYDGDPTAIPSFNLPCLIVDQTGDETSEGSMGEDDIEDQITVKVVLNKRDDWEGENVDPLNLTKKKLRNYVGKCDKDTGDYDEHTVKHAIRSLAFDGLEAVANSMTVDYKPVQRIIPSEDYADLTAEAHVTFTVQWSANTY